MLYYTIINKKGKNINKYCSCIVLGLIDLLTLVLISLKLCNIVAWSWYLILSSFLLTIIFILGLMVVLMLRQDRNV